VKELKKLQRNILYHYPFTLRNLKEISDHIEWDWVLNNRNMNWTVDKLQFVENHISIARKLRRNELLLNPSIASNQEIVLYYFDRLNKSLLPENSYINWNEFLLDKLNDQIELRSLKKLNWSNISMNPKIAWNSRFIEENKDLLDWDLLSLNQGLPWNEELIVNFEDRWNWNKLSQNHVINWSESIVIKYSNRLNWDKVSYSRNADFSIRFIEDNLSLINLKGLSRNHKIPWTIEFIERHEAELNFGNYGLSWNSSLPWDLQLMKRYKELWSWSGISSNRGIPWDTEIISTFSEELIWGSEKSLENSADQSHSRNGFNLSHNPSLPWTIAFLETWADYWSTDIDTNTGIWEKI
ncbi:unnamed protein product, partial [Discosporangium mesarthrocarpum]